MIYASDTGRRLGLNFSSLFRAVNPKRAGTGAETFGPPGVILAFRSSGIESAGTGAVRETVRSGNMRSESLRIRRRVFLGAGLSAAVVGSTAGCGSNKGQWRFFTEPEAGIVDAICARLIPADRDPGAHEAAAVRYIDIQLTRTFKKHRATYRAGLAAVDAASRAKAGKAFIDLPSAVQVEVLNTIEENSPVFFDLILTHTRQGFYGDPRHGGNRDMVSWKMLGLASPPIRGRERYDEPKVG